MFDLDVTVLDLQKAQDQIRKALEEQFGNAFVTIGLHEDQGGAASHPESELTNAKLGSILHFGADIDHPGGTSYGYKTEADAANGKVSFLAKGQGYAELGVTAPHKINIPARPWLDVGVATGNVRYMKIIEDGVNKEEPMNVTMGKIGVEAVGFTQKYMTELKSPPNSPYTIAKKGSDNPLIDTGLLRQSITFKVETDEPSEGV